MKYLSLSLLSLILFTACSTPPHKSTTDLQSLESHIEKAKAGNFGEMLVHMHKAETHLNQAETVYQQMRSRESNDQKLQKQGEQSAKRALAHRISAEKALENMLHPLEVGIESNTRNMEQVDYRLAYIEGLHIPEGIAIPEEHIYFESGRARMQSEQKDKIQEVVDFLREYPIFALELVGYADTVGARNNNYKLAEQRNRSVLAALRKRGLPTNTVITITVGEAEGADETHNPDNRRVELIPYVHGRYAQRISINANTAEQKPLAQ